MYTPIGSTIKDLLPFGNGGGTTTVDTTEPVITNVNAAAGQTSASINWETDEAASSQVEYGRDQQNTSFTEIEYDPTGGASAGVVSHSVVLTGLEPSTPAGNITYHYRVISKDAAGNEAVSGWKTFDTTLSDT